MTSLTTPRQADGVDQKVIGVRHTCGMLPKHGIRAGDIVALAQPRADQVDLEADRALLDHLKRGNYLNLKWKDIQLDEVEQSGQ